jgi:hypothetical protein
MPRRYFVLGGLLFSAAGLIAIWQFAFHGVHPRLIFWPPPAEVPPPAALEEDAEVDVVDAPLDDVLKGLAERHQVEIELDAAELTAAGVKPNQPVTMHVSGVRLRSLLSLLLRNLGLAWGVREGTVIVTTKSAWENNLANYVDRVYTLEPFLAGAARFDEQELADLLMRHVRPGEWQRTGGTGVVRAIPGALIVSHRPEVHEEIAALLACLAEAAQGTSGTAVIDVRPADSPRLRKIRAALREPTVIDAIEMPLHEVMARLSDRHRIPITFDTLSLDQVGVSTDTPITRQLDGISLGSALQLSLWDMDLTFVFEHDALSITSPESATCLTSKMYPIAGVLDQKTGIDAGELIEAAKVVATTHNWAGQMRRRHGEIDLWAHHLVVTQSLENHEMIEPFLAHMRQTVQPEIGAKRAIRQAPSTTLARIERALDKPVTLNCVETPLKDIIAQLKADLEIEIQFDNRELDGIGISTDTPITFHAQSVPLKEALHGVLCNIGASWEIRHEVLLITSDNRLASRWSQFKVLRQDGSWPGGADVPSRQVVNLITSVISPFSWERNGDESQIATVGETLVVWCTPDTERRIADLLAKLERFKHGGPPMPTQVLGLVDLPERSRLEAALRRPVAVDVHGEPLNEVVRRLAEESGVSISANCCDMGNVTASAEGVHLGMALDLLASREQVSHELSRYGIRLTTRKESLESPQARMYDVRDIVPPGSKYDAADLAAFIQSAVAPGTWQGDHGPGDIFRLPGLLVISQSPPIHAQIERLLALLRRLSSAKATGLKPDAVDAAMVQQITVAIGDLPLDEALQTLAREARVKIVLDHGALPQPLSPPRVSCPAGQSLGQTLDTLLARSDLAYCVRDDVLLVTCPVLAAQHAPIRAYPVGDLLKITDCRLPQRNRLPPSVSEVVAAPSPPPWGRDDPFVRTKSRFVRAIQASICLPRSSLPEDRGCALWGDWLVVTAGEPAQREIESLLMRLRRALLAQEFVSPESAGGDGSPVTVYDLRPVLARYPELDEGQIAEWIASMAEPLAIEIEHFGGMPYVPWHWYAPVAPLPGAVVARSATAQRCLEFLQRDADDLPRPWELVHDDSCRAISRLARLVETEQDSLRLGYALWLVALVETPSPQLGAALASRLERTEPSEDLQLYLQLCRATAHCGPQDDAALGPLEARLLALSQARLAAAPDRQAETVARKAETNTAPIEEEVLSAALVQTLAALGSRGRLAASRVAATCEPRSGPMKALTGILARFGDGDDLLPELLAWLDDDRFALPSVLAIIANLGTDGKVARRVLEQWEVTKNPKLQKRAKIMERLLELRFLRPGQPLPPYSIGGMGAAGIAF